MKKISPGWNLKLKGGGVGVALLHHWFLDTSSYMKTTNPFTLASMMMV